MTKQPQNVLELPLADRGLLALRAAVEKAIHEHAREGLPMYFWRDGKIVAVPAEELLEGNGHKKHPHMKGSRALRSSRGRHKSR